MAKRRSSLKGRGSEILFGDPQAVDLEPLDGDPAAAGSEHLPGDLTEPEPAAETLSNAPGNALVDLFLEDPELEMALREEALAGEIDPEEEEELEAEDVGPPPTPEMEMAFIEEAMVAEEPPEPVAEAPTPTLEVTMEEQELTEESAIHQPPPSEVSDVSADVLPPKPDRQYMGMGDVQPIGAADIQAPDGQEEELELPDRELMEEEEQALLARLGDVRIQALDAEISRTYEQVLSKVGESEDLATYCYNQLLKARDIVLRRDAPRIPQAEYYVEQVRARLRRATASESAARKYAWWIFGWGAGWGLFYIAILLLLNYDFFREVVIPSGTDSGAVTIDVFLQAMLWGGVGGVAAVWYSLFKHVGRRDFDTAVQHHLHRQTVPGSRSLARRCTWSSTC